MKVLITGADGFIGGNLELRLAERDDVEIVRHTRTDTVEALSGKLSGVDFVFHLAGVNRAENNRDFAIGNGDLTKALAKELCAVVGSTGKAIPTIYSSSTQAVLENAYGASKRDAENALKNARDEAGIPVHIFRMPNVFGKWARPNYNSAVATFCYNISRGLPVQVHAASAKLNLVYIDDVIDIFVAIMDGEQPENDSDSFCLISPVYATTVGEVVTLIELFRDSRDSLTIPPVGTGYVRALYATYVSYLPTEKFTYDLPMHGDQRGTFVEMLKTGNSGQFSYFTAHPGVTRGGHYHHSKTEKFLVIKGLARFKFRHMLSGETHDLTTNGDKAEIVETVPGWTHDITNIGDEELIVMLWANEMFDRERPDTYSCAL